MRLFATCLVALALAGPAEAATLHTSATRVSATELAIHLDVTVRHGTTIYVEGCADYAHDGGENCGGGKPRARKLRKGHSRVTVTVSNMAQHYTPPPLGTTEAWDAWAYRPAQTDLAFVYFKGKTALTETKPAATAADTLTQGGNP